MNFFNRIIQYYQRLPVLLKNKYAVLLLAFVIWMTFIDRDDVVTAIRLNMKLIEIENQKKYYREELIKTQEFEKAIFADDELLEKYVREKFYMKKKEETLYVIIEE